VRCPACGNRWYGTLADLRLRLHRLKCAGNLRRASERKRFMLFAAAYFAKLQAIKNYRLLCFKYGETATTGSSFWGHYARLRRLEITQILRLHRSGASIEAVLAILQRP